MTNKWYVRGVAAVLATVLAASLAGCGAASQEAEDAGAGGEATQTVATFPVVLTDDAGREVTITAEPKRIVSLAPANTEIVYALDRGDRLVGVTTWDDYPEAAKKLPKVGDFTTPNYEAIAAAKPDLVLVTGGVQADVIAKLEGLGATVLVVDPQDIDGVMRSIGAVGVALGAKDSADSLVAKMKADLAVVAKAVSGEKPVRTFVEIGWNPLFTAGTGTLLASMIEAAGGENVVTQKGYVGYSIEQLVKDQPAVYLGTKSSLGDAEGLEDRPGYPALTAVEMGSIHALDDNIVSRPGPRVVGGVEQIARALHPNAFEK